MAEEATQAEGQVQQQAPPVEGQESQGTPSQSDEYTMDNFLEEIKPIVESFNDPRTAAKSIKEAQRKITEQGQELSEVKRALQAEASQRQQLAQSLQHQVDKGTDFFDNPELKVWQAAQRAARDEVAKAKRDADIAELRAENPDLWEMTSPYTRKVLLENPHLNTGSLAGLRKAYKEGQELMKEAAVKQYKIIDSLVQGEIPPANEATPRKTEQDMQAQQEKNKSAYIPPSGTAKVPETNFEKKRQALIAAGDIDGLLDLKIPGKKG